MKITSFYVYILLCDNGSFYTGYTSNLEQRYQHHLKGSGGCKYTRSFKPIKIVQSWEVENRSLAMKMEYFIKQLSKKDKLNLIKCPDKLFEIFKCILPL